MDFLFHFVCESCFNRSSAAIVVALLLCVCIHFCLLLLLCSPDFPRIKNKKRKEVLDMGIHTELKVFTPIFFVYCKKILV